MVVPVGAFVFRHVHRPVFPLFGIPFGSHSLPAPFFPLFAKFRQPLGVLARISPQLLFRQIHFVPHFRHRIVLGHEGFANPRVCAFQIALLSRPEIRFGSPWFSPFLLHAEKKENGNEKRKEKSEKCSERGNNDEVCSFWLYFCEGTKIFTILAYCINDIFAYYSK
jgi:hypothetical protein